MNITLILNNFFHSVNHESKDDTSVQAKNAVQSKSEIDEDANENDDQHR